MFLQLALSLLSLIEPEDDVGKGQDNCAHDASNRAANDGGGLLLFGAGIGGRR